MAKIDKIQMPNGTVYDIGGGSPDEVTISLNTDDELQAIGVIDEGNGYAYKFREVTQAQYDAMKVAGTLDAHTHYSTPQEGNLLTLLDTLFPVGAYYLGDMATCPLAELGIGTWQALPSDTVIQIAGTRGSVGTTLNESLPNIKGSSSFDELSGVIVTSTATTSGSIYKGTTRSKTLATYNVQGSDLAFDASRSSSTYQDNAPVQPRARLTNGWIRIA